MDFALEKSEFMELPMNALLDVEAGGLGLAILSGVGTVCAAVVVAVCAPPGTKIIATAKVIGAGVLLTASAYYLD